jgi:hypothetical protein
MKSIDSTGSIQARNLKLDPLCGLAKGNLQFSGTLDLFGQSKITWSDFMVDLKAQSTPCDEQRTVQMFKPFVELKSC